MTKAKQQQSVKLYRKPERYWKQKILLNYSKQDMLYITQHQCKMAKKEKEKTLHCPKIIASSAWKIQQEKHLD